MAARGSRSRSRQAAVWGALLLSIVFVAIPLAALRLTGSPSLLWLLSGWVQLVLVFWCVVGVVLLVERVRRWVHRG